MFYQIINAASFELQFQFLSLLSDKNKLYADTLTSMICSYISHIESLLCKFDNVIHTYITFKMGADTLWNIITDEHLKQSKHITTSKKKLKTLH